MDIISIPPKLADIESMLAADETVVCRNATVIVNKRGTVSWLDNAKPIQIIKNTEERSETNGML